MNVISVYNQKGGVGKTSLSVLLGLFASQENKKVLLIDLDPQESLSQIAKKTGQGKTVFGWLSGSSLNECIESISDNLYLVRGDINLIRIMNGIPINQIKNLLRKEEIDLVILDCQPTYNNLVVSGLNASDKIIVPTLQSDFDLKSLLLSLEIISEIERPIEKYIVFNRQKSITKDIEKRFFSIPEIQSFTSFCFPNSVSIRKDIKNLRLSDKIKESVSGLYYGLWGVL